MGSGWGRACLEREQHVLFCPLSLGAAGGKITEPDLLWSWGLSTFTMGEFSVASDLSPSPALDPLGRTCLALQDCRFSLFLSLCTPPRSPCVRLSPSPHPSRHAESYPSLHCMLPSFHHLWDLPSDSAPSSP